YLKKLRATPDGDGSLLDHMMILYGSGISNSNAHAPDNLPQLLVGGGSGQLKGGRHLKFANKPSNANLLVAIMDKMGVPGEKVGGSASKLQLDTLPVWGCQRIPRPIRLSLALLGMSSVVAAAGRPAIIEAVRKGDKDTLRTL